MSIHDMSIHDMSIYDWIVANCPFESWEDRAHGQLDYENLIHLPDEFRESFKEDGQKLEAREPDFVKFIEFRVPNTDKHCLDKWEKWAAPHIATLCKAIINKDGAKIEKVACGMYLGFDMYDDLFYSRWEWFDVCNMAAEAVARASQNARQSAKESLRTIEQFLMESKNFYALATCLNIAAALRTNIYGKAENIAALPTLYANLTHSFVFELMVYAGFSLVKMGLNSVVFEMAKRVKNKSLLPLLCALEAENDKVREWLLYEASEILLSGDASPFVIKKGRMLEYVRSHGFSRELFVKSAKMLDYLCDFWVDVDLYQLEDGYSILDLFLESVPKQSLWAEFALNLKRGADAQECRQMTHIFAQILQCMDQLVAAYEWYHNRSDGLYHDDGDGGEGRYFSRAGVSVKRINEHLAGVRWVAFSSGIDWDKAINGYERDHYATYVASRKHTLDMGESEINALGERLKPKLAWLNEDVVDFE